MHAFCEDAQALGARMVAGGRAPRDPKNGFFWSPTVIADIPDQAKAMTQEPFGPLALVAALHDTRRSAATGQRA
jgi:succinate-semialdehyde dehydrogenase/glutarate-semialdehyde dehydrogenase